jgi:hypothetical protein
MAQAPDAKFQDFSHAGQNVDIVGHHDRHTIVVVASFPALDPRPSPMLRRTQ